MTDIYMFKIAIKIIFFERQSEKFDMMSEKCLKKCS